MGRAFLNWFWKHLDAGKVDMYLVIFYIPLLAWGIAATFVVTPIEVIETVMGNRIYDYWAWMNIVGTGCTMVGMAPNGGGGRYVGLWMRMGGNACMGLVLLAFEYSAFVGAMPLDHGDSLMVFVMLALAPYMVSTFLLSIRAGRELWQIEKLKRKGVAS